MLSSIQRRRRKRQRTTQHDRPLRVDRYAEVFDGRGIVMRGCPSFVTSREYTGRYPWLFVSTMKEDCAAHVNEMCRRLEVHSRPMLWHVALFRHAFVRAVSSTSVEWPSCRRSFKQGFLPCFAVSKPCRWHNRCTKDTKPVHRSPMI